MMFPEFAIFAYACLAFGVVSFVYSLYVVFKTDKKDEANCVFEKPFFKEWNAEPFYHILFENKWSARRWYESGRLQGVKEVKAILEKIKKK